MTAVRGTPLAARAPTGHRAGNGWGGGSMKLLLFGWLALVEAACLAALLAADSVSPSRVAVERRANEELVRALALTDLALWTEARYARHPSQADLFSAFQDGVAAMEHFPAGVFAPPPARIDGWAGLAPADTADDSAP